MIEVYPLADVDTPVDSSTAVILAPETALPAGSTTVPTRAVLLATWACIRVANAKQAVVDTKIARRVNEHFIGLSSLLIGTPKNLRLGKLVVNAALACALRVRQKQWAYLNRIDWILELEPRELYKR